MVRVLLFLRMAAPVRQLRDCSGAAHLLCITSSIVHDMALFLKPRFYISLPRLNFEAPVIPSTSRAAHAANQIQVSAS